MSCKKKGISMYSFLLRRYALGALTAAQLRYCAPKWLTAKQVEEIIRIVGEGGTEEMPSFVPLPYIGG